MKILVDYQIFLAQKYGGISNYHSIIHRMINELQTPHQSTIMALGSENKYIPPQGILLRPLNLKGKKILRSINQYALNSVLPRYDVFHPSYYDNYFLQVKKAPPIVLTIHDVIPERYFNDPSGIQLINNKKNLIQRAAKIIAISQTTKSAIVEVYAIDPDKIAVIPHGSPDYFEAFNQSAPQDKSSPYLLYVGLRKSYKNFPVFLGNVSGFLLNQSVTLKVVGPPPTAEELALVHDLGLDAYISFHIHPSLEELYHFYNQALCFVFPSLEEGFGIPLLEAAAAGCPILCSDIPIFREVCGDSALYFEPLSRESLLQQLEKVSGDPLLRAALIQKGRENLRRFSWQKTAMDTLAVYESTMQ